MGKIYGAWKNDLHCWDIQNILLGKIRKKQYINSYVYYKGIIYISHVDFGHLMGRTYILEGDYVIWNGP